MQVRSLLARWTRRLSNLHKPLLSAWWGTHGHAPRSWHRCSAKRPTPLRKARHSLMRMPRGTSRLGEVMMLRRSVERLAAPARLRGRRVRMPRSGLNSPRAGSRRALAQAPVSGAPHVITRCVVVSDARALTVATDRRHPCRSHKHRRQRASPPHRATPARDRARKRRSRGPANVCESAAVNPIRSASSTSNATPRATPSPSLSAVTSSVPK